MPLWRSILAGLSGAGALAAFSYALLALDLKDLFVAGNTGARTLHTAVYAVLLICLAILALAVSRKESPGEGVLLRGKLSKRTVMTLVVAILSIPLTLFLGPRYFHDRKYYVVSLLVLLEAMLPFFLIFEGRKPQARELVILAVLCGLAIGGQAAFFALPGFKPVAAMVILSGVAFGGEAGFLVGSCHHAGIQHALQPGALDSLADVCHGASGAHRRYPIPEGAAPPGRLSLSVFGGQQ